MAIAYKSAGAGTSTETSGGALSPACPAVVDAGDILIAHVFWEGTTTAPSTPTDWTLLSGPHVIQSTIARNWVFGKVAVGNEDGTTIAFGSPAVTTQRGARVYSFSGRVAGTITELVNGFAATSHATDPQMPTVTTTESGNLAVALVGQNDNNAQASATGESGGDWVEAVAGYVAALTPGLALQIQTCTPTANPGTVSGGASATANDPVGVVGFQIKQSNPQLVTPSIATLAVATFAPTVSTPRLVTPGILALAISAFAPTVTAGAGVVVTPPIVALVTSTFAPTVTASDNKLVTPSTLAMTTATFAPQVSTPRLVTPPTLAIVTGTFAPVVTIGVNVVPGTATLTTSAFAPTIQTPRLVTPATLTLATSTFAPTVSAPRLVTPATSALALSSFSPAVLTPRLVTPSTLSLATSAFAPTITTPRLVTALTASLTLTTFPPTVTASGGGDPVTVTPQTASISISLLAPTVTISTSGGSGSGAGSFQSLMDAHRIMNHNRAVLNRQRAQRDSRDKADTDISLILDTDGFE